MNKVHFSKNPYTVIFGAYSEISKVLLVKLINKGLRYFILTEQPNQISDLKEYVKKIYSHESTLDIKIFEYDATKDVNSQFRDFIERDFTIDKCIYTIGINDFCSALNVTEDSWDKIINVNLKSYFFAIQSIAKKMISHGGKIVGISSQHGIVANYDRAPYCASKAAMNHLTKELALEWAKYDIQINTVAPTFILYDKNSHILFSSKYRRTALSKIPNHNYATPDDVAEVIEFLLLCKTKMITGQTILVDGGWCLQ